MQWGEGPPRSTFERMRRGETKTWGRRLVENRETLSTWLMGLAAVVTTWCAFESSKWSGVQSIEFAQSSAARVESTRDELAANQTLQVDIATFLAWVQALRAERAGQRLGSGEGYQPDPAQLSGFLYERFRPEFRPVVSAWIATRPLQSKDAPPTPFAMREYPRPLLERAEQSLRVSEEKAQSGRDANRTADRYMLATVLTALVVFFAGLSTKLLLPKNGFTMLTLALLCFALCVVILLRLPVII